MRALMMLIGYLSTATVVSLAFGVGYLWQTERLDDEKLFRMIALVHDVDIEGMEDEQGDAAATTPEEEPSLADIERYRAVYARNFEVKQDALKRGVDAFDHAFRKLETATKHFSELATKIETELKHQGALSSEEAVSKVVRDLELLGPEEAKRDLLKFFDGPEGPRDVLLLMNAMSTGKLKNILKRFKTEDELQKLHQLHQLQLSGGPQAESLRQGFQELNAFKSQQP